MSPKIAAVLPLTAGVIALAGCGDVKEGFDKSWKESFVASCTKGAGPRVDAATASTLCTCIGDYMQAHLSRAELANPASERAEKMGDEATAACIAKQFPDAGR